MCQKEKKRLTYLFSHEVAIQHSFSVLQIRKIRFLAFWIMKQLVINTLSRGVFRIGGSKNSFDC